MMEGLQAAVLQGAVSGLLAAAAVDVAAFRAWKSFNELLSYDWKLASWRWVQGATLGAIGALTIGNLF